MMHAQLPAEPLQNIRKSTWMDTAQLVVSILVFIVFLALSGLSILGLVQSKNSFQLNVLSPSLWALGFGFLILAIISLVSALTTRRAYYEKRPIQFLRKPASWLNWIAILLPLLIAAAYFVFKAFSPPEFIIPLITIGIMAVAMLWILKLGFKDQWGNNMKRDTGLFTFSMSFGTLYIGVLQLVLVLIFGFIALAVLSQGVDFQSVFNNLSQNIGSQEAMYEFLNSRTETPAFALGITIFVALMAPLIEELFKTIGVWFLKGRQISKAEGWFAGLVSGAGFGLIEAFLYATQGVLLTTFDEWIVFTLGRIGGILLHTITGGIIGMALSKSWREKRPGHAIKAYLLALVLHGLWNFVAISQNIAPGLFGIDLPDFAIYISLAIIFVGMLVAFLIISYKIRMETMLSGSSANAGAIKVQALDDESLLIRRGP